jgi:hypothetical protein
MIKRLIDLFPHAHNWLADKDFIWWPFSFLRPAPSIAITFKHTLLMTGCFGGLTFLMFTVFAVMNSMFTADSAISTLFFSFIGFFVWFNVVTRPLWNYRARRLSVKK